VAAAGREEEACRTEGSSGLTEKKILHGWVIYSMILFLIYYVNIIYIILILNIYIT
jgi:hypothetical protein